MHSSRTNTIAYYGIFIALAFIFGWLETFLPNPLEGMVPGIKLGLANLVIIVALYRLGFFPATGISLVRVLLTAFTFGNLSMFFYSLAGAGLLVDYIDAQTGRLVLKLRIVDMKPCVKRTLGTLIRSF